MKILLCDSDTSARGVTKRLIQIATSCDVEECASGPEATDPPTMVFVGRDLGPVGPAPLVRYLTRLGTKTFIKVAHEDEITTERATRLYAEVIPRTFIPAAVLKDLRRFLSRRDGAMDRLIEHVPDIRSLISKTAAATSRAGAGRHRAWRGRSSWCHGRRDDGRGRAG
jgi:hypothetical protein